MTQLLEEVFKEASKLPEKDQNALARWLREEIKSERIWEKLFSESENELEIMAEKALHEFATNRTTELKHKKL